MGAPPTVSLACELSAWSSRG